MNTCCDANDVVFACPSPVAWSNFAFQSYTLSGETLFDYDKSPNSAQDPTNGGASFSRSTDVSSGLLRDATNASTCVPEVNTPVDPSQRCGPEPSASWAYYDGPDAEPGTIDDDVYAWCMRLDGSPLATGAGAPLDSNHRNFLLDTDLDGWKEFWVDSDGASPDKNRIMYQNNPAGTMDGSRSVRCHFPLASPLGASDWVRVTDLLDGAGAGNGNNEYEYCVQVPVACLNDGAGNQTVDGLFTPVRFVYSTGTSNQDPLQKDFIVDCGLSEPCTTANGGAQQVPVTLSFATATHRGDQTTLRWATATESFNAGFDVYVRTAGGSFRRVNDVLVPTRGGNSTQLQRYEVTLTGIEDEFHIASVDVYGDFQMHGPFRVGHEHGAQPAAQQRVRWDVVREQHAQLAAQRLERRLARARTARRGELASAGAELRVDDDGMHRVTYAELTAAGIDFAGVAADELALTLGDRPVPIHVGGADRFGPGSYIDFYGEGVRSLYTRTRVYRLRHAPSLAARVARDRRPPGRTAPVAHYFETRVLEENRAYNFSAPNADPWYWRQLYARAKPVSMSIPLELDHLVSGAGDVSLHVETWGAADLPESPDHHVALRIGDQTLAEAHANGVVRIPLRAQVDAAAFAGGAADLQLVLPADTGARFDMVNLERVTVTYPRAFVARDGALAFTAQGSSFAVTGFDSHEVVAYRIDDGVPTLLTARAAEDSAYGVTAYFRGTPRRASYVVADTGGLLHPAIALGRERADLTRGPAEYLVIAHPSFIEGLAPLVAAREADGLAVQVVDVEDIYASYSNGVVDPEAIRRHIAFAATELGTRFVLLVGGDTIDYHDYLGAGSFSFVPTPYTRTHEVVSYTPSDPKLADIDGDNVPDLPIGRLPVRTTEELALVIAKTLAYPAARHARRAVFAADADEQGLSYAAMSDGLIRELGAGWSIRRAYLTASDAAVARDTIIGGIESGAALTAFFGHSGPTVWTFGGLFNAVHASALDNPQPTIVTQLGCWNTYYVEPELETLGHQFLLNPNGGAAAVMGGATLTNTSHDLQLAHPLLRAMLRQGMSIGEAMVEAKQTLSRDQLDVLLGWTLLGDPALRLATPSNEVVVDAAAPASGPPSRAPEGPAAPVHGAASAASADGARAGCRAAPGAGGSGGGGLYLAILLGWCVCRRVRAARLQAPSR